MLKLSVYNQSGEDTGKSVELNSRIFEAVTKPEVLHGVVMARLSNLRRATASVKTRGEVRGGGKKPWKQKGTGRARAGSIRSPLWRGGGIIFGPRTERNFYKKVNKKTGRLALFAVLTDRARAGQLLVVEDLNLPEGKTRALWQKLQPLTKKFPAPVKKILIVLPARQEKLARAAANLPSVSLALAANLNILELLENQGMIVLEDALSVIEKTYLKTV